MLKVLELMTSFHILVQRGTYAAASKELSVTVNELDKCIFELELLLEAPLLHRKADTVIAASPNLPVIPTDAGVRWFFIIGELLAGSNNLSAFSQSFLGCLEKTLSYVSDISQKHFDGNHLTNFTCVSFFHC